jgi:hypothetical protein
MDMDMKRDEMMANRDCIETPWLAILKIATIPTI